MYIESFPSYEQIKSDYQLIKTNKQGEYEEKSYDLFMLSVGGHFRLKINEDGLKKISLDYIGEDGYLHGLLGLGRTTKVCINHLYPLNKKNYQALFNLYKFIIHNLYAEILKVEKSLEEL